MKDNQNFSYEYNAGQQEEIKKIRQKYLPQEADKMELLRKLDNSVTQLATMISIIIGVVGTLIMGVGMCCCLVWADFFVLGVIVGVVGIVVLSLAYPVYNVIIKKQREKIAPEILRLTDELMK